MYDYVLSLLRQTDSDPLSMVERISQARVALDIIEAQAVHELRTTIPQTSYGDIGAAQGISKQASRMRHAKPC